MDPPMHSRTPNRPTQIPPPRFLLDMPLLPTPTSSPSPAKGTLLHLPPTIPRPHPSPTTFPRASASSLHEGPAFLSSPLLSAASLKDCLAIAPTKMIPAPPPSPSTMLIEAVLASTTNTNTSSNLYLPDTPSNPSTTNTNDDNDPSHMAMTALSLAILESAAENTTTATTIDQAVENAGKALAVPADDFDAANDALTSSTEGFGFLKALEEFHKDSSYANLLGLNVFAEQGWRCEEDVAMVDTQPTQAAPGWVPNTMAPISLDSLLLDDAPAPAFPTAPIAPPAADDFMQMLMGPLKLDTAPPTTAEGQPASDLDYEEIDIMKVLEAAPMREVAADPEPVAVASPAALAQSEAESEESGWASRDEDVVAAVLGVECKGLRRPNGFLLYRNSKTPIATAVRNALLDGKSATHELRVTDLIAMLWNAEPPTVQDWWCDMAKELVRRGNPAAHEPPAQDTPLPKLRVSGSKQKVPETKWIDCSSGKKPKRAAPTPATEANPATMTPKTRRSNSETDAAMETPKPARRTTARTASTPTPRPKPYPGDLCLDQEAPTKEHRYRRRRREAYRQRRLQAADDTTVITVVDTPPVVLPPPAPAAPEDSEAALREALSQMASAIAAPVETAFVRRMTEMRGDAAAATDGVEQVVGIRIHRTEPSPEDMRRRRRQARREQTAGAGLWCPRSPPASSRGGSPVETRATTTAAAASVAAWGASPAAAPAAVPIPVFGDDGDEMDIRFDDMEAMAERLARVGGGSGVARDGAARQAVVEAQVTTVVEEDFFCFSPAPEGI
ncbi:hypothetical protein HDU96_001151 [Phlyctochytrium bullatum]|nr:hypothetical protein HDU96_001151 [Phlyctochytrium bullatum]